MVSDWTHISEPIAGLLHRFGITTKNEASPLMRRHQFDCECGVRGPWQRDKDSAAEDGMAHQEHESA